MLSWSSTSIPALQMNGNVAKPNDEKAKLLNTFFASKYAYFKNLHFPLANEDFLDIQYLDNFRWRLPLQWQPNSWYACFPGRNQV